MTASNIRTDAGTVAAHTPGPRTVKPDDYSKAVHIQASGPLNICHLSGTAVAREDSAANARLIAAAPDLLMLAEEVEEYLSCIAIESDIPNPDDVTAFCDDMCGNKLCNVNGCIKYRIRFARNVIARATVQA